MTSSHFLLRYLVFCSILLLAACAPKIATRGNLLDPEKIVQIKTGESTREDVINKLGSPTEVSTFDEKIWYYYGRKTEQYSFLNPEVVEQRAIEIKFNDEGVVTALNQLDPNDRRDITPASGSTPTYGHDMTFVEQLVGNLGKTAKKK